MKSELGEIDRLRAALRMEREECAVIAENFSTGDGYEIAHIIRTRGGTMSEIESAVPSELNANLTPLVTWVKQIAILTTMCAIIGCTIASSMWPAWMIMIISGWCHYGDAVIKSKQVG